MTSQESDTLYNAVRNSSGKISIPSKNKYLFGCCCCITEKWYIQHAGLASIKYYDDNINHCCTCFDCCTWCLEFRTRKYFVCERQIACYLCCCSIYFI